jgi:hypothetical protein
MVDGSEPLEIPRTARGTVLFFHVALRFLPFKMNDWRESLMYIAAKTRFDRFNHFYSSRAPFFCPSSSTDRSEAGTKYLYILIEMNIREKKKLMMMMVEDTHRADSTTISLSFARQ